MVCPHHELTIAHAVPIVMAIEIYSVSEDNNNYLTQSINRQYTQESGTKGQPGKDAAYISAIYTKSVIKEIITSN